MLRFILPCFASSCRLFELRVYLLSSLGECWLINKYLAHTLTKSINMLESAPSLNIIHHRFSLYTPPLKNTYPSSYTVKLHIKKTELITDSSSEPRFIQRSRPGTTIHRSDARHHVPIHAHWWIRIQFKPKIYHLFTTLCQNDRTSGHFRRWLWPSRSRAVFWSFLGCGILMDYREKKKWYVCEWVYE